MLTFLSVEETGKSGLFPLRSRIFREEINIGTVTAQSIRCVHNRGALPWRKIGRLCGEDKGRLLCSQELKLPEEQGFMRFYCDELKVRLCVNTVLGIFQMDENMAKDMRVGIYDPDGRIPDVAGMLLKYTSSVTAVSRMVGLYSAEAKRLLEEKGAVLSVSKRMKALSDSHIIIAPVRLETKLPSDNKAVIFTVDCPKAEQVCDVYYRYFFSLGDELTALLSLGFDSEYIASALYALLGRYDLGSTVPQAIKGTAAAHTLVSMKKHLYKMTEKYREKVQTNT